MNLSSRTPLLVSAVALAMVAAGSVATAGPALAASRPIVAVGAENEYADVISQVGGPYVRVSAIMSNPNTDPHEFEASASVAEVVSKAELIVQNGVGYDTFMDKIEAASPRPGRDVIVAQQLLGSAGQHLQPPPLVRPAHHAAGGQGRGDRLVRARACPRRLLPGQRTGFRQVAAALAETPSPRSRSATRAHR